MATLTKPCEVCEVTVVKPASCSLANWPKRRFCSTACKKTSQRGQASPTKGRTFDRPRHYIACRICGQATRYLGLEGARLTGKVHCGSEDCRKESRALTNTRISDRATSMYASGERQRLIGNWSHVRTISAEEEMLMPWFNSIGWTAQYRFVPGTSQRSFRLDFAHPDLRLNAEIDGTSHRTAKRKARDAQRDATLTAQGWRVLRIQAKDVQTDADSVRERVLAWIAES